MTGLNHTATGAVIGLGIGRPELALPLAFCSHFLLDLMPHYGVEYRDRHHYPSFRRMVGTDAVLTPIFILAVFLATGSWLVLACMILAIAPDFVWFAKYGNDRLAGREFTLPKDLFSRFHKKIQWGERSWGWTIELVWAVGILNVLRTML